MKNANNDFVIVGKVGSTYGVLGWLKVSTYTEYGTSILNYSPWYLGNNENEFKAIKLEEGQVYGNGIIAKFAGINNPEDARLYTGKLIAVSRAQLPKLQHNEYYWADLEGMSVINQHGELLGKVIYMMATGSNDVLVIKGTKEHAIPYLPGDVITCVDLAKREIHVDWELI